MSEQDSSVAKIMNFTGKARAIFGSADRAPSHEEMSPESKASLVKKEEEAEQWNLYADDKGDSYLIEKS